jgi:putative PIN family toxin of toxin-antitoxin system
VHERKLRPRIVIDTNVCVSGLISAAGPPAQVLRAVQTNKVVHLVSDPIVEEYLRVLNYPRIRKFTKISDAFVADVAAYLLFQTERIELLSMIELISDPDDAVFLKTAIDGRADMVISGDKAGLLALRFIDRIPIVSAAEAVARLEL